MNFTKFITEYNHLLAKDPRKTKLYRQWNQKFSSEKNRKAIINSEDEVNEKLKTYMLEWIEGRDGEKKINMDNDEILFKNEQYDEALNSSFEITKLVYKKLFNEELKSFTNLDYHNAQDYCMQNSYTMPRIFDRKKFLDIGSGFGRSVSIPSKLVKDLIYCSIDIQKEQYFFQYLD